jgi:hypothetical protein
VRHPYLLRLAGPVTIISVQSSSNDLSWPDAVDVLIDHDRPDVDALRDQAQVLRARLEEIAREFTDHPAMLVTMVRPMTERAQAKLGDIEPSWPMLGRYRPAGRADWC